MLSKNKVVKRAVKALESLYEGVCTVTEHQKIRNENGSTGFKEVSVLENIPCRLSFKTIGTTNGADNMASAVEQVTTLFVSPDIQIKPGSKVTVTQNGVTTEYAHSGKSAVYAAHQEIILDVFERWA